MDHKRACQVEGWHLEAVQALALLSSDSQALTAWVGLTAWMEGSVAAGAEELSWIAVGAKPAQLVPCSQCFLMKLERPFFQEVHEKKCIWAGVTLQAALIRCSLQKIQHKFCGAYAFVSHFSDFLTFTDTWGFVSAAGSRSHTGTWVVSLRYSLFQLYFKLWCTHRHCSCLKYTFGSFWKATAGICWRALYLSKARGCDFPVTRPHHKRWIFSERCIQSPEALEHLYWHFQPNPSLLLTLVWWRFAPSSWLVQKWSPWFSLETGNLSILGLTSSSLFLSFSWQL